MLIVYNKSQQFELNNITKSKLSMQDLNPTKNYNKKVFQTPHHQKRQDFNKSIRKQWIDQKFKKGRSNFQISEKYQLFITYIERLKEDCFNQQLIQVIGNYSKSKTNQREPNYFNAQVIRELKYPLKTLFKVLTDQKYRRKIETQQKKILYDIAFHHMKFLLQAISKSFQYNAKYQRTKSINPKDDEFWSTIRSLFTHKIDTTFNAYIFQITRSLLFYHDARQYYFKNDLIKTLVNTLGNFENGNALRMLTHLFLSETHILTQSHIEDIATIVKYQLNLEYDIQESYNGHIIKQNSEIQQIQKGQQNQVQLYTTKLLLKNLDTANLSKEQRSLLSQRLTSYLLQIMKLYPPKQQKIFQQLLNILIKIDKEEKIQKRKTQLFIAVLKKLQLKYIFSQINNSQEGNQIIQFKSQQQSKLFCRCFYALHSKYKQYMVEELNNFQIAIQYSYKDLEFDYLIVLTYLKMQMENNWKSVNIKMLLFWLDKHKMEIPVRRLILKAIRIDLRSQIDQQDQDKILQVSESLDDTDFSWWFFKNQLNKIGQSELNQIQEQFNQEFSRQELNLEQ